MFPIDPDLLRPKTEIWIRSGKEQWVKALILATEPEPKPYVEVQMLGGEFEGEVLRLPLNLITISLKPPAYPGISGDIEECNSRYNLKELQNIARDHKIPFSGLTKLDLCRKLVGAGAIG